MTSRTGRRPRRLLSGVIPVLIVLAAASACIGDGVTVTETADTDCPDRVGADFLDGFRDHAQSIDSHPSKRCGRTFVVEAPDGRGEEVQHALAVWLQSDEGSLTEQGYGWLGSLSVGDGFYDVSLTRSPGAAGAFAHGWDTVELLLEPRHTGVSAPDGSEIPAAWIGAPRIAEGHAVVPAGDRLIGFDLESGRQVWTGEHCPDMDWAGPIAGPEARVQVVDCHGVLTGVDAATGETAWEYQNRERLDRVRTGPDVLVLQSDSSIRAIDLDSGEERWRQRGFGDANVAADDQRVYVSNDEGTYALDADSGRREWSVDVPASGLFASADAVFARTTLHRLVRLDPATGEREWTTDRDDLRLDWSDVMGASDDAVALLGTRSGALTVYDAATGRQLWQADGAMGVAVGDEVLVASDLFVGQLVVFDLTTGEHLLELGEPAAEFPAVGADRVVSVARDGEGQRLQIDEVK